MLIVLSKRKIALIFLLLALLTAAVLTYSRFHSTGQSGQAIGNGSKEYVILIHIDDKKLYLLKDGQVIKKYTIASGKTGFSSPIGDWKVANKGMPNEKALGMRWIGLNVPWGNYGIHGTNDEGRIGQAVSHGCIRMRSRDVIELYNMIDVGTPVVIRNGPYGPFGMGFKTLKAGQRGADVVAVQRRLKELGYYNGAVSGIYGEELNYALRNFQRKNGLTVENKITHDDYVAMGFIEFD